MIARPEPRSQIALASHSYESVRGDLSPGYIGAIPDRNTTGAASHGFYSFSGGYYGMAKTNYAAVGGACGNRASTKAASYANTKLQRYAGIYYNRSRTAFTGITDGASNALAFGEGVAGRANSGTDRFQWRWITVGPIPTLLNILIAPDSANAMYRFMSRHTGVVQFGTGDGSVRALRAPSGSTIGYANWLNLQRMAGRADGEVIDPSGF